MNVREEKPGMVTLDLAAHAASEIGATVTALGLLLSYATMKQENTTREQFLEMCGELWDDWEAHTK